MCLSFSFPIFVDYDDDAEGEVTLGKPLLHLWELFLDLWWFLPLK